MELQGPCLLGRLVDSSPKPYSVFPKLHTLNPTLSPINVVVISFRRLRVPRVEATAHYPDGPCTEMHAWRCRVLGVPGLESLTSLGFKQERFRKVSECRGFRDS